LHMVQTYRASICRKACMMPFDIHVSGKQLAWQLPQHRA